MRKIVKFLSLAGLVTVSASALAQSFSMGLGGVPPGSSEARVVQSSMGRHSAKLDELAKFGWSWWVPSNAGRYNPSDANGRPNQWVNAGVTYDGTNFIMFDNPANDNLNKPATFGISVLSRAGESVGIQATFCSMRKTYNPEGTGYEVDIQMMNSAGYTTAPDHANWLATGNVSGGALEVCKTIYRRYDNTTDWGFRGAASQVHFILSAIASDNWKGGVYQGPWRQWYYAQHGGSSLEGGGDAHLKVYVKNVSISRSSATTGTSSYYLPLAADIN